MAEAPPASVTTLIPHDQLRCPSCSKWMGQLGAGLGAEVQLAKRQHHAQASAGCMVLKCQKCRALIEVCYVRMAA